MADQDLDDFAQTTGLDDSDHVAIRKNSDGLWRKMLGSDLKSAIGSGENLLVNGDMRVAQTGTSFTSTDSANDDDSYTLDQCILLSDGNDVVDVTQESSGGVDGFSKYLRMDVETVSKKFGHLFPIENLDAIGVAGGTVSLSFDAVVSDAAKLSDIRAVVLAWDGSADSITSDVVNAWGAEGSNPTWATNWTAENTPSDLGVTASWARYKIENISLDTSGITNLAVFIWSNDVATNDTLANTLDITNVKLEAGSVATPFRSRAFSEEMSKCARFFYRLGDGSKSATQSVAVGYANSTTLALQPIVFGFQMRTAPSLSISDAGHFLVSNQGSDITATGISLSGPTDVSGRLDVTVSAGLTANTATLFRVQDASATLDFDARL